MVGWHGWRTGRIRASTAMFEADSCRSIGPRMERGRRRPGSERGAGLVRFALVSPTWSDWGLVVGPVRFAWLTAPYGDWRLVMGRCGSARTQAPLGHALPEALLRDAARGSNQRPARLLPPAVDLPRQRPKSGIGSERGDTPSRHPTRAWAAQSRRVHSTPRISADARPAADRVRHRVRTPSDRPSTPEWNTGART
jgi:hypothetical protein